MTLRTKFLAAAPVALALLATPAVAETQTEISNQERTAIWFTVPDATLQALLPAGWTSNPNAMGAAQGGNLVIVLIESTLATDPQGAPLAVGPRNLVAVVSAPVRDAAGTPHTMVLGGYIADPATSPGYYQNYAAGTMTLVRNESYGAGLAVTVTETWQVTGPDGGTMTVDLDWTRGVPTLSRFDTRVVSGTDTTRLRFYRGHQGNDVIMSVPANINKGTVTFTADGGIFDRVFDGQERLIAAISVPWYYREVFVP